MHDQGVAFAAQVGARDGVQEVAARAVGRATRGAVPQRHKRPVASGTQLRHVQTTQPNLDHVVVPNNWPRDRHTVASIRVGSS